MVIGEVITKHFLWPLSHTERFWPHQCVCVCVFIVSGYWTTRGCHQRLCVLNFPFWQHLRDRELSSPRFGNPRVGVSAMNRFFASAVDILCLDVRV